MPANIEIKARVTDFEELRRKAEAISDLPCQLISQVDTFFKCPQGRLKLRELGPARGQLIYYQRQDVAGPKHSEYQVFETDDPDGLKRILSQSLDEVGVVTKLRYLYMVGQTRVHLDDVQGLGKFMELEVVLLPGQTDAEGKAIAAELMGTLGIFEGDLIEGAYMDMFVK